MRTFAQKQKPTQQIKVASSTTHGRAWSSQSQAVRSILHLQRTIGNHAVQRLLTADTEKLKTDSKTRTMNQPKLTINTPGDTHEQEASRVADHVMHMPEPYRQETSSCDGGRSSCRKAQDVHEQLQAKPIQINDTEKSIVPFLIRRVNHTPGQPLDAGAREFMEPRFGYDFSQVRVHNDTKAVQSAEAINALAYTTGRDVVFGAGKYSPNTNTGRKLLAHELAHVIQQNRLRDVRQNPALPPAFSSLQRVSVQARLGTAAVPSLQVGEVIQRSATVTHRRRIDNRPDLIRFQMDRPASREALSAQIRTDLVAALHTEVWTPIVGRIESINDDLSGLFDQTEDQSQISFELSVAWFNPSTVEQLSLLSPYAESSAASVAEAPAQEPEPEREEAEGESSRVESCPSWTPVNDHYVSTRIIELLRQHGGDTGAAFHQSREERNRAENCCNLSHAAIEHYFMHRSDVGEGQTEAWYVQVEQTVGAIGRLFYRGRRTGNCPPSPSSSEVRRWEGCGIADGQRDLETTPQERGVGGMSSREFLERRLRNTTSPPSQIEMIHRENQMWSPPIAPR